MKKRRVVEVASEGYSARGQLWGFGVGHLARLLRMKPGSVRQAIKAGRLNPSDLGALFAFYQKRSATPSRREEVADV